MTATLPSPRSVIARGAVAGLVGVLGLTAAPDSAQAAPAHGVPLRSSGPATTAYVAGHDDALPRGRRVVRYTVKPGDTATELAVRFHAWTAELISYNHLGSSGQVYVGQRLRIPVVIAAARSDNRREDGARQHDRQKLGDDHSRPDRNHRHRTDPARTRIREIVARTARRQGVDPHLALAVSWQESGWQMGRDSSAGAIGAMQVLPTTGVWMSMYAGRVLRLRDPHDNALAGILLLRVLDDMTKTRRGKIGAYYQGIGAVREHWLYPSTRDYVANVLALKRRLEHGWDPAR